MISKLYKNTKNPEKRKESILIAIVVCFFFFNILNIIIEDHEQVIKGFISIVTSHAILITDYLVIGGVGGTFLNAFSILIFNYTLMKVFKVPVTGLSVAANFTVFGFSFFGKNIFNILPIYLGGILYCKYESIDFKEILVILFFTSALAPYISEVAFSINAGEGAYINAVCLGAIIGFLVTPLAKKMANFHEGFNLYNVGFTGGILGSVISAVMKAYHFEITDKKIISEHYHEPLLILSVIAFSGFILIGYYKNNRSFKGLSDLFKDSGHKVDFIAKYGVEVTLINMGILGFVGIAYILVMNQILSGPLLAGVLTMVGFGAYGKHIKNTLPILIGVTLASYGTTVSDNFTVVLSGLFGTSMAPIAGVYGTFWGIIAGWLHLSVVRSIGVMHGGLNLYNNGFSAGIVAGVLLPVMNTVNENIKMRKNMYLERRKTIHDTMAEVKKYLKTKEEDDSVEGKDA